MAFLAISGSGTVNWFQHNAPIANLRARPVSFNFQTVNSYDVSVLSQLRALGIPDRRFIVARSTLLPQRGLLNWNVQTYPLIEHASVVATELWVFAEMRDAVGKSHLYLIARKVGDAQKEIFSKNTSVREAPLQVAKELGESGFQLKSSRSYSLNENISESGLLLDGKSERCHIQYIGNANTGDDYLVEGERTVDQVRMVIACLRTSHIWLGEGASLQDLLPNCEVIDMAGDYERSWLKLHQQEQLPAILRVVRRVLPERGFITGCIAYGRDLIFRRSLQPAASVVTEGSIREEIVIGAGTEKNAIRESFQSYGVVTARTLDSMPREEQNVLQLVPPLSEHEETIEAERHTEGACG